MKLSRCVAAATLAATAFTSSGPAQAQRVQAMAVQVRTQEVGPLPAVFRPSAMMSWADDKSIQTFLALPGQIGLVRLTLEPALTDSGSLADYRTRLRNEIPRLKQLAARGASIVLTVARMPRWLSSNRSEASNGDSGWTVREASPPKDLAAFEDLAFETVRTINVEQGLDVLYEFWNEPEANIFWLGTQDQLFKAYAAFSSGARRADPKARVGGLGGSWNARRPEQPDNAPGVLRAFIDNVAANRLPLDFVSWHNYPKLPFEGWEGTGLVREWLSARALPARTPQIVTEWNQWTTFPNWMDPSRDDVNGAAFMMASLHEMSLSGVSMQTFSSLQDQKDPPAGTAFPGDFGLLTRAPVLKKAGFHAMNMLAMLDGQQRISVGLPPADAEAQGVDVLASTGGGRISVLLSRFAPTNAATLSAVFPKSLRRSGVTARSQIAASDEKIIAYVKHELELGPADASTSVRQSLEVARSAAEQARDRQADEVAVTLQMAALPASTRYRVFRIDPTHLNPGRAYRDARARGATHADGLAAARSQQSFEPTLSGTGAVPELRLPQFSIVLVLLETGP